MKRAIDWEKFLAKSDIVCEDLPHKWDEGAFLGNGNFGALLYHNENEELIIKLGHTCIHDNRPPKGVHVNDKMFQTARLPIGDFVLKTVGKVTGGSMRVHIYDATVTGTVITDCGEINYSAYIASDRDATVFEWTATQGEQNSKFQWHPAYAESPRQTKMRELNDNNRYNHNYEMPKMCFYSNIDGIDICTQPKYCYGAYSTGWKTVKKGNVNKLYYSIANSDDVDASIAAVKNNVIDAETNEEEIRKIHLDWWHNCYQRSFVSVSDSVFEEFYWIQIYKMASATRADGKIIDTIGPWLTTTSWPAGFWNLNVQLTYEPMYPANQLEVASSLWKNLLKEFDNLVNNVDEPYRKDCAGIGSNTTANLTSLVAVPGRDKEGYVELGNLTWILHCCYLNYRMTMDNKILEDVIYPLLKRTVQYYRYFLIKEDDGKYHIMPTSSPEYGIVDWDCNYDHSLLRWGCKTLIKICDILNVEDENLAVWNDILENIAPFPENEKEGFQISRNYPMAKSHRHYSHLLMFYPLHLLSPYVDEEREKIVKSIAQWHSMPKELEGYSQTGAASMFATMGDGNNALKFLSTLWSKFIRPNTMYKEHGGAVIETPVSAANSMLDMLIQSWDNNIHIFPAIPDKWQDVTIDNLCAEGAFRVSAGMKNGKLQWVNVKSLAGEPCVIKADFGGEKVVSNKDYTVNGIEYTVDLKAGEEVTISLEGVEAIAEPVKTTDGMENCYGMNKKAYKILSKVSYLDLK